MNLFNGGSLSDELVKEVAVPVVSVINAQGEGTGKNMTAAAEKERAREERQQERDFVVPVRADEGLAIR